MKAIRVVMTSPARLPHFLVMAYSSLEDAFTTVLVEEGKRAGKMYEVVERDDGGYLGDEFCEYLYSCVYFERLVAFAYHFRERKLHNHNYKEFVNSRCPFAVLSNDLFGAVIYYRHDEDFYRALDRIDTKFLDDFEILTTEKELKKHFWWSKEPKIY